jgi:ribosomal protein S18 acetylase RimI-like enzyme
MPVPRSIRCGIRKHHFSLDISEPLEQQMHHASFKFTRLRKADMKLVAQLDANLFGADAWSEETFLEAFVDGNHSWHALKRDGELVAYCLVYTKGRTTSIESIGTAKSMQGLGLGTILMNRVIGKALQSERKSIRLEVHESNFGAQKLYKRFGFRPVRMTTEPFYADGGKAIIMRLRLERVEHASVSSRQLRKQMTALNTQSTAA